MRSIFLIVVWLTSWGSDCTAPASATPQNTGSGTFLLDRRSVDEVTDEMVRNLHVRPGFKEWYAAPAGKKGATGKLDDPFDLESALAGKNGISPGDILWLRGGKYVGAFTVRLSGTDGEPIHVRQYPGERALIEKDFAKRDTATLAVRGDHIWFWDFEVATSYSDRSRNDPEGEMNPWRGSGINVWGAKTKYINLIVRDNGHGFGLWNEDGGTEIYGCVIFNNGNNKKEHGVYGHNRTGSHLIEGNVIFNNAGYGLHLYANSKKSNVSGFAVVNNAVFTNGALTETDQVADQILIGGVEGVPADRVIVRSNYVFNFPDAPTSKNRGIRLGYEDRSNGNALIEDNYIVSKVPLRILWWNEVHVRGNTIDSTSRSVEIESPNGAKATFTGNKYHTGGRSGPAFEIDGSRIGWSEWNRHAGMVQGDEVIERGSSAVFTVPNKYQTGRGTVTIFNHDAVDRVVIGPPTFLQKGDGYEVYDAQNLFAPAIASGVFDGKPIDVQFTRAEPAQPVGDVERMPVHTAPRFAVYIIVRTSTRK
jgi:hypothetical protein